jgi:hypothetical protein
MLKYYIGWDPRDENAYEVCVKSMLIHTNSVVECWPLKDWILRQLGYYYRAYMVDPQGQMVDMKTNIPFSTAFSFTRYLIPLIEEYKDEWVLFTDPDILWRTDILELFNSIDIDDGKAIYCVKHNHKPEETIKMNGIAQIGYMRKNWASVMLINPSRCRYLTKYVVNNLCKDHLHTLTWLPDDEIGELPEEWNWLDGWSSPGLDPKIVHFTRGVPDMAGYEDTLYADEWRQVLDPLPLPELDKAI